jgi:diketogulonate reductase-like aldo/keto reductase
VRAAVKTGYRGIDTAACYENEGLIRSSIDGCGIDRNELTVTSKLWNNSHGYDKALRAFDESEKKLRSIDIYLIHWPGPVPGFLETWTALEHLYEQGRVKTIGVSNFMVPQLEILLDRCRIRPMVNQIECHLWYTDYPLIDLCRRNNIAVQAFSPLSAGSGLIRNQTLQDIAEGLNRSPAQVALRYLLQIGVIPIPKSSNPLRIAENFHIFDFRIPDSEMEVLKGMNRLVRTNKDPLGLVRPGLSVVRTRSDKSTPTTSAKFLSVSIAKYLDKPGKHDTLRLS